MEVSNHRAARLRRELDRIEGAIEDIKWANN